MLVQLTKAERALIVTAIDTAVANTTLSEEIERLATTLRRKIETDSNTATFVFDSKEAQGSISVMRTVYGLGVYLGELDTSTPNLLIDLFYKTDLGKAIKPNMPTAIYIWGSSQDGREEVIVEVTDDGSITVKSQE